MNLRLEALVLTRGLAGARIHWMSTELLAVLPVAVQLPSVLSFRWQPSALMRADQFVFLRPFVEFVG